MKRITLSLLVFIVTLFSNQLLYANEETRQEVDYILEEIETSKLRQSDIQPIQLYEEQVPNQKSTETKSTDTNTILNYSPFKLRGNGSAETYYNSPVYTSDNIPEYDGYYYTAYNGYIYKIKSSNHVTTKIALPTGYYAKTTVHLYKGKLFYIAENNYLVQYDIATGLLTQRNFKVKDEWIIAGSRGIDMIFYNDCMYLSLRESLGYFDCLTFIKFDFKTNLTYLITIPEFEGSYDSVLLSPNYGGDFFVMLPCIEFDKVDTIFFLDFSTGVLQIYYNKIEPALLSVEDRIPYELESWGTATYKANIHLFDNGILLTNCTTTNASEGYVNYFISYDDFKYYHVEIPGVYQQTAFIGDYNTTPKLLTTGFYSYEIFELIDCTFLFVSDKYNLSDEVSQIDCIENEVLRCTLNLSYFDIGKGRQLFSVMIPKVSTGNNKWTFYNDSDYGKYFRYSRYISTENYNTFEVVDESELFGTVLEGRVINQWGTPVPNTYVQTLDTECWSDSEGIFQLRKFSEHTWGEFGFYNIWIEKEGYYSNHFDYNDSVQSYFNIGDIVLNKNHYTVTGTVVDKKGDKVINSDVTIQGVKGKTDNNGTFNVNIPIKN